MTARPRPRFEDRAKDWLRAFDLILEEIEGPAVKLATEAGIDYPATIRYANRQAAAIAAATLVAGGTRPEASRG